MVYETKGEMPDSDCRVVRESAGFQGFCLK